jgi:hypothetical protein
MSLKKLSSNFLEKREKAIINKLNLNQQVRMMIKSSNNLLKT